MQADEQNRGSRGAGAGPPPPPGASCPPGRPPSPADAARAHEARTVSAADYAKTSSAGASSSYASSAPSGAQPHAQPQPRPGAARAVWVEDTGKNPNAGPRFDAGDAGPSPADAFREAMAKVGEIKEYASYFVTAKVDGVKASVRNVVVYAALGVVGLLVGGAILATAAVLLLTGLAGAINMLFAGTAHPERWQWVGALVVSLLVLGGTVAGVMIGLKKVTGGGRRNTVKKYETRQRVQREQFGRDVHDRAAQRQVRAGAEAGAVGRRNGHA
jgi:hypothetical protein